MVRITNHRGEHLAKELEARRMSAHSWARDVFRKRKARRPISANLTIKKM